jgi:hypothetical protein
VTNRLPPRRPVCCRHPARPHIIAAQAPFLPIDSESLFRVAVDTPDGTALTRLVHTPSRGNMYSHVSGLQSGGAYEVTIFREELTVRPNAVHWPPPPIVPPQADDSIAKQQFFEDHRHGGAIQDLRLRPRPGPAEAIQRSIHKSNPGKHRRSPGTCPFHSPVPASLAPPGQGPLPRIPCSEDG